MWKLARKRGGSSLSCYRRATFPSAPEGSKITRDDLQKAFARYRLRYSEAKAKQTLAAATGTGEVANVPGEKIAVGFKALALSPAVLEACGGTPLTASKFPAPTAGQSVEARLGELAVAIYSAR